MFSAVVKLSLIDAYVLPIITYALEAALTDSNSLYAVGCYNTGLKLRLYVDTVTITYATNILAYKQLYISQPAPQH